MRLAAIFAAGLFAFPAAADSDLGHRLFTAEAVPACGICHTLAAAGTEGAVGPVLGVKASGGVRDAAGAHAMLEAGATRIGASASVAIVGGGQAGSSGY